MEISAAEAAAKKMEITDTISSREAADDELVVLQHELRLARALLEEERQLRLDAERAAAVLTKELTEARKALLSKTTTPAARTDNSLHLLMLPDDVLVTNILKRLPAVAVSACARTCRTMRRLCGDERIWKHRYHEDFLLPHESLVHEDEVTSWRDEYQIQATTEVVSLGQNEDGTLSSAATFPQLQKLALRSITCGIQHAAALTAGGSVFTWGKSELVGHRSAQGSLGISSLMRLPRFDSEPCADVKCGYFFSIALTREGRVYIWGGVDEDSGPCLREPTLVQFPPPSGAQPAGHSTTTGASQTRIERIAIGGSHFMALSTDGILYTWGSNAFGQLGNGTVVDDFQEDPQPVAALRYRRIRAMTCGYAHSIVVTDGGVYAWGRNNCGQLGLGHNFETPTPTCMVSIPRNAQVDDVQCGTFHTILLLGGAVYTCGANNYGQLGQGDSLTRPTATRVRSFDDKGALAIASGHHHCAILAGDGRVWAFGWTKFASLVKEERKASQSVETPIQLAVSANLAPVHVQASHHFTIVRCRRVRSRETRHPRQQRLLRWFGLRP